MKTKGKIIWNKINWKIVQLKVWRIQCKIYDCSIRKDKVQVVKLQRNLIKLIEAKLLAVRKVTQDNKGKKTAGIDGVKLLHPNKRVDLAYKIKIDGRCDPIKRRMIPKPGKPGESRPLGIPTIRDRAKQALALIALEPEWEAKFDPNSFGFRPGRRTHDAIEAIHSSINKSPKYVLDGDIRKCFDRIDHDALLAKLDTFSVMHRQVHSWLKAKIVMDEETIFPKEGTPQGGILSPLLANIALDGIERDLSDWVAEIPAWSPGGHHISKPNRRRRLTFIRYADDFVVLHPEKEVIEASREIIEKLINKMGLELHPEKTNTAHTFLSLGNRKPGFKFLGFWIRNYPVGIRKRGKRKAGYKTFIRPHPHNISNVLRKIKGILRYTKTIRSLVEQLNPIIRGWSNYFNTVASKRTFSAMDEKLMIQLMRWAKRKHRRRQRSWIRDRYLLRDTRKGKSRLRFGYLGPNNEIIGIHYFAETPIVRHVKISSARSIYDNDLIYWSQRGRPLGNRSRSRSIIRLLKEQNNKCEGCGLIFLPGDIIEVDHIVPKSHGGSKDYSNLQLLHGHCHDQKIEERGAV